MTPRTPPGQTREKIFQFVRDRLLEGLPPTVREIQEHFGFKAVQTAQEHLRRLIDEGRLIRKKGKARGYALPGRDIATEPNTLFVPLLGRVQAGALNTAIEDCEGYIPVQSRGIGVIETPPKHAAASPRRGGARRKSGATPRSSGPNRGPADAQNQPSGHGQLFALRVEGESMIGVGIMPGDIAIVRSQPTAVSGDIVVALVGDEATVKTLRIRFDRIELHPENPAYETIIPGPDECTILGKVVETRRHIEPPRL
jgi:repressor LexA